MPYYLLYTFWIKLALLLLWIVLGTAASIKAYDDGFKKFPIKRKLVLFPFFGPLVMVIFIVAMTCRALNEIPKFIYNNFFNYKEYQKKQFKRINEEF
jgi:hypothetical protein